MLNQSKRYCIIKMMLQIDKIEASAYNVICEGVFCSRIY